MDQILIEQHLGKDWVELITVDVEENSTKEDAVEAVDTLIKMYASKESMYITKKDGFGIVITRSNGPIRMMLLPENRV